jgi:protocatechuate 3,4-dioxygenase beta subunit
MYFPGDPLQPLDPIFNSIPDENARQQVGFPPRYGTRSQPDYALTYAFDIVLRGSHDTPFEGAAKP